MRVSLNAVKACWRFIASYAKYGLVVLSVIVYLICGITTFAAFFWPPSQMAIKLSLLGLNFACAVLLSSKRLLEPYLPMKRLET